MAGRAILCVWLPDCGIACELARLPHLKGQPVALVDAKQILAAVSPSAAACGLRPGQPATFARSLCAGLVALPYDPAAYRKAAEAAWDVLAVESSVIEPVSPEMVFVEMAGTEIESRAAYLAARIGETAGMVAHIGIGHSKLVAERGARQLSETGIFVTAGREAALLDVTPLAELTTIPAKWQARAAKLGLRTLGDVLRTPAAEMKRQFGEGALLLRRLAAGQDGSPVASVWPPQSLEHSVQFDYDDVRGEQAVSEALRVCAQTIAGEIGTQYCRRLTLTLQLCDGDILMQQEELSMPARSPDHLHRAALRLVQRLKIDRGLQGVRLQASRLSDGGGVQLALMDGGDGSGISFEQQRSLDAAVTHVKQRYGGHAVLPAALLHQAQRIHLWTYRLGQIADEPVCVDTNAQGYPACVYREASWRQAASRCAITAIQNVWRETDWAWDKAVETACFRVVTESAGLYELHRRGAEWRLRAVAD